MTLDKNLLQRLVEQKIRISSLQIQNKKFANEFMGSLSNGDISMICQTIRGALTGELPRKALDELHINLRSLK